MTQKALIIDDERLARRELRTLLAEHSEIEIIGEAESLKDALHKINLTKPDVIFLDVQMRGETGFDLLEQLDFSGKIIFVTAFDEFAVRAFEVNALDYLLKPINPNRLSQALERLQNDSDICQKTLRKLEYDDRLFLEINDRSVFLGVSSIICISASGDYSEIYTADGKKLLSLKPLREWEERLPQKNFVRIHRSTIINFEYVEKVESWFNRSYQVFLNGIKEPFTISRRYSVAIKERFN
jgi:two-component system, LytTR family, response regulator